MGAMPVMQPGMGGPMAYGMQQPGQMQYMNKGEIGGANGTYQMGMGAGVMAG